MNYEAFSRSHEKYSIDVTYLDRETAVLLYKGKLYEDDNHQYAFQSALEDEGLKLGFDIETEIDQVAEETYRLSKNNDIFTYSIYEDGTNRYFIAHFTNHLSDGWAYLQKYVEEPDMQVGYFSEDDWQGKKCIVFK